MNRWAETVLDAELARDVPPTPTPKPSTTGRNHSIG